MPSSCLMSDMVGAEGGTQSIVRETCPSDLISCQLERNEGKIWRVGTKSIERETPKTFSKSRWFIWNSAFVVGYVQPQFHWILAPKMMTQSKALKRHTSSIHALKINPIPQIFLITIRLTPQGHWIWWLSRLYYGGWLTKAIQFWRSRRRIGNQNWSEWGLWDTTFPAATALNIAWL